MIARLILPALLLTGMHASCALAAGNFSGTWTSKSGGDSNALKCGLTQRGDTLSGACEGPPFGPVSGKVDGRNVTWTVPLLGPNFPVQMQFAGQWDLKNTATVFRSFKNIPAGSKANGEKTMVFSRAPAAP